jgi:hypothetical protein
MKGKLLLSTAALVAGIALASAQDTPRGGGQPGGQPGGAAQSQGAPGGGAQDRQQSQSPKGGGQAQQDQGKKGQKDQGKQVQKDQGKDQGKQGQTQRGQRDQTTGQREQSPSAQGQRDQTPAKTERGQRDQGRDQGKQGPAGGQAEQGRSGSAVNLSTEQRTRIRETVLVGGNAPRVNNVNFSVRVGTVVPRTVRVVAVPSVLVEIHPQWRGYMYFVVGDEIIIVDRNHRIIAVLAV